MKNKKLIITAIIVGLIAVLGIARMTVVRSYDKENPQLTCLSKMCFGTYLVYDTETGVEYIQSCQRGGYTYTVRLDKSGNPCVYEEYK